MPLLVLDQVATLGLAEPVCVVRVVPDAGLAGRLPEVGLLISALRAVLLLFLEAALAELLTRELDFGLLALVAPVAVEVKGEAILAAKAWLPIGRQHPDLAITDDPLTIVPVLVTTHWVNRHDVEFLQIRLENVT